MSYKITGMACSCDNALEMLEVFIPDSLPEEVKTDQFCEDYEKVLNRLRYSLSKHIPMKPRFQKGKYSSIYDSYTCGNCGFGLRTDIYKYCPSCGQMIDWKGDK